MAARRASRTRVVLALAAASVAIPLLAVGVASALVIARFARAVVIPPARKDEDQRILRVSNDIVTLADSVDARTPGRYSLFFDQDRGHARVGGILARGPEGITRELLSVDSGEISRARTARFSGWFHLHPRELGLPWRDVEVATELGPAPAWLVPAQEETGDWAIMVHGRAVRREEALRAIPVFHAAGYSSLLVSYRNDGDAPRSPDHRFALGDAEWRDVDGAIEFALARGAKRVVLFGWSMGGATVLQVATRSAHAAAIRGIVLDSPVIDWVTALDFQGELNRIPRGLRRGTMAVISSGWGRAITGQSVSIDLARLDFVRRASELAVPILLMHSDDDGYIPATASRALAIARPDIVEYVPFDTARHTRLWNYDPERWTAAIAAWLAQLP